MAAPTKSSNQTYYTNHALITLDALQHCGEFEYFFLLFGFDQKLCNVKCVKNLSRKSFVTFETKMTHSKKSTFKSSFTFDKFNRAANDAIPKGLLLRSLLNTCLRWGDFKRGCVIDTVNMYFGACKRRISSSLVVLLFTF